MILDYLEDRLDADARAKVEDHLAGSCSRCRALLHEVGRLAGAMRADRTPRVPAELRARALEVFGAPVDPVAAGAGLWQMARLLFDSRIEPLPATVRRSVGEARWLRFALDDAVLEIEAEPEAAGLVTVRGSLTSSDPALFRIEIASAGECATAWPDAAGRFSIERVPAGEASVTVVAPERRWRLPPLDL
jgi:hypothetical protein